MRWARWRYVRIRCIDPGTILEPQAHGDYALAALRARGSQARYDHLRARGQLPNMPDLRTMFAYSCLPIEQGKFPIMLVPTSPGPSSAPGLREKGQTEGDSHATPHDRVKEKDPRGGRQ